MEYIKIAVIVFAFVLITTCCAVCSNILKQQEQIHDLNEKIDSLQRINADSAINLQTSALF